MSLESNKQLARDIISAATSGDMETMGRLMTDDATWWLLPSMGGLRTKEELLGMLPGLWENLETPLETKFIDFTAEEDRVSVTFTGRATLKNGNVYDNNYHVLMFIRDGKVARAKEYFDTAHAKEVFGF